ncbi:MAG: putative selenate reductase subunit YgfK [Lachnospiraceae bacterium]|nr:putative selenate reductase subunit YgfK [Lachnospiraceae bacterium]
MSDRMKPIPYENLLDQVLTEYKTSGTVFGVRRKYRYDPDDLNSILDIFGTPLEIPFGPAAGPNTQLAQNIAAAYFAGSRFFELKTVQKIDGEDLPVSKPCILAEDEGYNVEWSTELTVPQAMEEYIKAWWLCKTMAAEFDLGSVNGFIFNMSVGYDLEGIKSPKIDAFIEGLKEAKNLEIWETCRLATIRARESGKMTHIFTPNPHVCNSVTLSTLHGCPAEDIEKIATYLLTEKKLNTFIKLNPTLLGYDYARKTLDDMGYGYVQFGRFHFEDDLQYEKAVPMLQRLQALADSLGLEFGVKITNTFPVDIKRSELPGNEMYMSGRALYPLSLSVALKLSRDFDGKLKISFSGGADAFNIMNLYKAGIWPITFATTILKPGGYNRITQMTHRFEQVLNNAFRRKFAAQKQGLEPPAKDAAIEKARTRQIDVPALEKILENALTDPHHTKPVKTVSSRKSRKTLPLFDCFMSPCSDTCPINQDITAYMQLVDEGRYLDALKVITYRNPLPNITGTICAHPCMSSCTRRFYESSVNIRGKKLTAAKEASIALEKYLGEKSLHDIKSNGIKVAVIGAGPAGIASAFLLARAGFEPVVYEKRASGGGTVAHVITEQRIPRDAIAQDIAFATALGAKFIYGKKIRDLEGLKKEGFRYVIVCVGAGKPGVLKLAGDASGNENSVPDPAGTVAQGKGCGIINAIEFLERVVKHDPSLDPGSNVVVIGAGNTAMDAARAAKLLGSGSTVSIVYRRDRRNMPADEEELSLALEDGVEFRELLSPFAFSDGKLFCKKNVLGDFDASGRQTPVETDEIVTIPADTVITAVGEKIDKDLYDALEIEVDEKGRPITDANNQSSTDCVYIAGDGLKGPATIVEAIHDATVAVNDIIRRSGTKTDDNPIIAEARNLICESFSNADTEALYAKKGILDITGLIKDDVPGPCLGCDKVCENCADVCPNRANMVIAVPGTAHPQILHIDDMCNECGNCSVFCPYNGNPYKDKFTLFSDLKSFTDSTNQGFILLDKENRTFRVRFENEITDEEPFDGYCSLNDTVREFIKTVFTDHPYLF